MDNSKSNATKQADLERQDIAELLGRILASHWLSRRPPGVQSPVEEEDKISAEKPVD